MRHFLLLFAAASLLAAACSQPAITPAAEGTETPAPITPTAVPTTAAAIPERFRGVWDAVTGSCDPVSDLRMEIGAVSIEFYESLGAVTGVTVESTDSIVVDLAMEGEGERWTRKNRYVLSDGGATLTPSEVGGPPAAAIPRTRCAN